MKWVWIVLGALAALVLLAAGIGALLDPDHVAARRAVFARAPAQVWATIVDFEHAASWRRDVSKVEVTRGDTVRFVEHTRHGATPMAVDELEPERRMVVRIDDPALPFSGSWTFELQPTDGGTALTITERGSVKNPIIRLLGKLFFDPSATATRYLEDLGTSFGETVVPAPPPA